MKKLLFTLSFVALLTSNLLSNETNEDETLSLDDENKVIEPAEKVLLTGDVEKYLSLSSAKFQKIDTKYPITAAYYVENGYIYISVKSLTVNKPISIGFTRSQEVEEAEQLRNVDYISVAYNENKKAYVVRDGFARRVDKPSNLREKQDVSLLDYKSEKGYTYFKVRRKLVTGDKFDYPIETGMPFTLVFLVKEADSKDILNSDFVEITLQ